MLWFIVLEILHCKLNISRWFSGNINITLIKALLKLYLSNIENSEIRQSNLVLLCSTCILLYFSPEGGLKYIFYWVSLEHRVRSKQAHYFIITLLLPALDAFTITKMRQTFRSGLQRACILKAKQAQYSITYQTLTRVQWIV